MSVSTEREKRGSLASINRSPRRAAMDEKTFGSQAEASSSIASRMEVLPQLLAPTKRLTRPRPRISSLSKPRKFATVNSRIMIVRVVGRAPTRSFLLQRRQVFDEVAHLFDAESLREVGGHQRDFLLLELLDLFLFERARQRVGSF